MRVKLTLSCLFSLLILSSCTSIRLPDREVSMKNGLERQRQFIERLFGPLDTKRHRKIDGRKGDESDIVSAAWYGFDTNDSTHILTSALNSGASFILIPDMGSPWFTEPLYINSNTTIVLEEGAEIHAKQGSFHKGGASLFNLVNIDNITIYGYGARIKMHKDDYRKPPYKKAQWRMAINIKGCKDISILGLTAESSGGDGLYLGSGDRGFNENIVIKDVTLRDHFRQGISVISAKNLLIENTEMSYTEGHSPAAGIDFEPNKPDETFINCTVRNCVIRNNSGPGILICVKAHNEDTVPFDITIEDSYVFNNFIAIHILESKKMAGGTLVLRNTILNGFQFIPSIDSLNIIKE